MNPEAPDPVVVEFEARITALLLGELSPEEAADVRRILAVNPAWRQLHDQLQGTLGVVHQAVKAPAASGDPNRPRNQLSAERRLALLQRFRTSPSAATRRRSRLDSSGWLPLSLAATLMLLFAAGGLLPTLSRPKSQSFPRSGNWRDSAGRVEESLVQLDHGAFARELAESRPLSGSVPTMPAGPVGAGVGIDPMPRGSVDAPIDVVAVAPEGLALDFKERAFPKALSLNTTIAAPNTEVEGKSAGGGSTVGASVYGGVIGGIGGIGGGGFGRVGGAVNGTTVPALAAIDPRQNSAVEDYYSLREDTQESRVEKLGFGLPPADSVVVGDRLAGVAQNAPAHFDLAQAARPELKLAEADRESSLGLHVEAKSEDTRGREWIASAGKPLADLPELDTSARYRNSRFSGGLMTNRTAAPAPAPAPALVAAPAPALVSPEMIAAENAFSTFSLNVSDVSFKLAAASLEKGVLPDPASIRSEEFINALHYRDPEAASGAPLAFAWERAQYPFAHNRDVLRLAVRTAVRGRESTRPLNLVLLLDNSGSMERADRVAILREALRTLSILLQSRDRISVVTFARTARLWVDALPGSEAGTLAERVGELNPEGGTNLEEALKLAYATAARHLVAQGVNRVVLVTDGAANLGDVDPASLKRTVEAWRQRGVALDCFGIGWEGLNDDLLETLSRNGDGRYGFVNTPEEAAQNFASQLAGALHVAAADVKVQVEFNPQRVSVWRQVGYARHQLTKAQFRDNTVDAAELAAAESGNSVYIVEVQPTGTGPLATVRARFREPETGLYREQAWAVPYQGPALPLDRAAPTLRLAAIASAFSEWLSGSPYAGDVQPGRLLAILQGVPAAFDPDPTPRMLETMLRQAQSISGR